MGNFTLSGTADTDRHPTESSADDETRASQAVTVRDVHEDDLFPWLAVFDDYAQHNDTTLNDEVTLRLWTWLADPNHPESGLVALRGDEIVGLAHFHAVDRPLDSDRIIVVDDIYAVGDDRDDAATALLTAVQERGSAIGARALQWIQPAEDESAWLQNTGQVKRTTVTMSEVAITPEP